VIGVMPGKIITERLSIRPADRVMARQAGRSDAGCHQGRGDRTPRQIRPGEGIGRGFVTGSG
jgi:hypothetical protein